MKLLNVIVAILKKQPWKIVNVILHIYFSNRGLELAKLPKFVHGNKLDILAYVET